MIDIEKVDDMYNSYKILKRKGYYSKGRYVPPKYRKITAPHDELKEEQRKIMEELSIIKLSDRAFGFVKGKDIQDNAKEHIKAKWILELDLKDFFDTVSRAQVFEALLNNNIGKDRAEYISTVCTRYGYLPQGSPASPILSNIVWKPIDKKIEKVARKHNCTYTRYADDVTLSSEDKDNGYAVLQELKKEVTSIIHKYGFKINGTKTRTIGSHRRKSVTGITVDSNKGDIYPSKDLRLEVQNALRAIEVDIKGGKISKLSDFDIHTPYSSLRSKISYMCSVNKAQNEHFLKKLNWLKGQVSG